MASFYVFIIDFTTVSHLLYKITYLINVFPETNIFLGTVLAFRSVGMIVA